MPEMRRAFTLVELMIVVAIIGILASIAIPNFVEMQYRAKRAELPTIIRGLKEAERSYEASMNKYMTVEIHPVALPGKVPATWGVGNADFRFLGWEPDGKVRGQYSVITWPASPTTPAGDFRVTGICDVDGDTTTAVYTATKSINAVMNTLNDTY